MKYLTPKQLKITLTVITLLVVTVAKFWLWNIKDAPTVEAGWWNPG